MKLNRLLFKSLILFCIFNANVSYSDGIKHVDIFEHFKQVAIFKDSAALHYPIQKWEKPLRFSTILSSPELDISSIEEVMEIILPNLKLHEYSFVKRNPNFLILYG